MKRLWRTLGAIALGMVFLVGCGDEPTDVTLNGQPIGSTETGVENNGQIGQEESGERITLTLGTVGTDRRLESAVESYNA